MKKNIRFFLKYAFFLYLFVTAVFFRLLLFIRYGRKKQRLFQPLLSV